MNRLQPFGDPELEKQLENGHDVYKFCFPDMTRGNLQNTVAVLFSYLSC